MKNIKLDSGHIAKYKKDKMSERMFIDITDFNKGYGDLSSIESHIALLNNLKSVGWKSVGVDITLDRYDTTDEFILEVIKK